MTRPCPEALLLRALAEDSLGPDEDWVRVHAADCSSCQRRVDLARREEASLRAALPAEPPRDLLDRTLAAVAAEARGPQPRRRPRRSESQLSWLFPAAAVALTALALAWFWPQGSPPPQKPAQTPRVTPSSLNTPRVKGSPRLKPAVEATPQPSPSPSRSPKPSPEPTPSASPEVIVKKLPPDPLPTPTPTPTASPRDPTQPPTQVTPQPAALARVRAGKVSAGDQVYALGAALPAGVELSVSGRVAEVESPGAVRLVLAPRTRFRVSENKGGRLIRLEEGRLLATSAGKVPYALATADGLATPVGTTFLLTRRRGSTRVATLEGAVRFEVGDTRLLVRAGFEALARKGKLAGPALLWSSPAKALKWLPRDRRPVLPKRLRVVRSFAFERDAQGFGKGTWRAGGAHGSRGALASVAHGDSWSRVVEIEDAAGVVTLDPDLWVEATVRVSRKTRLALQVWDFDRKENWTHIVSVEPGRWVTLSASLRQFTDAAGKPRGRVVKLGNRGSTFNVFAGQQGEQVELLVDDVRFVR